MQFSEILSLGGKALKFTTLVVSKNLTTFLVLPLTFGKRGQNQGESISMDMNKAKWSLWSQEHMSKLINYKKRFIL